MSKTEILDECLKLSTEDRAEILGTLWALENDAHRGPTPEKAALLDAELDELERGGDPGRPWEQCLAELRKKP